MLSILRRNRRRFIRAAQCTLRVNNFRSRPSLSRTNITERYLIHTQHNSYPPNFDFSLFILAAFPNKAQHAVRSSSIEFGGNFVFSLIKSTSLSTRARERESERFKKAIRKKWIELVIAGVMRPSLRTIYSFLSRARSRSARIFQILSGSSLRFRLFPV